MLRPMDIAGPEDCNEGRGATGNFTDLIASLWLDIQRRIQAIKWDDNEDGVKTQFKERIKILKIHVILTDTFKTRPVKRIATSKIQT